MYNSNKLILFFLIGLLPFVSLAQTSSKSPYSIYGIGDLESDGLSSQIGMGDVKYGIASHNNINVANASTFGHIAQTTFDVGLKANFLTLSTDGQKQSSYTSYLKNISLVFPVSKRWGLGFGLLPVSSMGYDLEDSETISGIGDVTYSYSGNGGLSKVYFGNAVNILRDSVHQLSIGLTGAYLFGALEKERDIVVGDFTSFKTKYVNELRLNGFNFDLSGSYKRKMVYKTENQIDKYAVLIVGATYGLGTEMNTYTKDMVYTYTGGTVFQTKDTIVFNQDTGKTVLPQKMGIGFSVNMNEKWMFAADFSSVDWTKLSILGSQSTLSRASQFAVGLQYTPDYNAISSVRKMVRYRTGFRYANTRLNVNGTNIKEFGTTFGIGVPIISSQSRTMFNIALEYGQRGTEANSLTKEQFTNIVIGISMTPHKFDRWFVKRKID
jgi:hypothetical protein